MTDANLYFEFNLICGVLNHPDWIAELPSYLKPEHFQTEICRDIFQFLAENRNAKLADIIKNFQEKHAPADILKIDNFTFLTRKGDIISSAQIVVELFKEREVRALAQEFATETNPDEIKRKITEIQNLGKEEKPVDVDVELGQELDRIASGQPDSRNIATGFKSIDEKIDGFRKSELVILGGRPGSGKTTLALNIAFNIARRRKNVLFFSLEMSRFELHKRLVSSITELKPFAGMSAQSFEKMMNTSRKVVSELPLTVNDRAGITIEDIFSECEKAKKLGRLDMVVIDHLSILKSKKTFKSRYEEVSDLSRQLKVLAKEMDVPVLCLCQLNRAVEGRDLKMPTMSDLRDSGSIEQDADLIMFVYRPEYNLRQREPEEVNSPEHLKWEDELNAVRGKAFIGVAKNRRGETGQMKLGFNGKYSKFMEAA